MRSSPPGTVSAASGRAAVSLGGVMLCVMLGPCINTVDYNVVNDLLLKRMRGLATDVMWVYIWLSIGLGFLYPLVFAVATSGLPLQV